LAEKNDFRIHAISVSKLQPLEPVLHFLEREAKGAEFSNYGAAKSTFGTSRTDGGTLKKSPSDLKPNMFATSGSGSGFLRRHFASAPDINRRAVGTGGFACGQARAPEGAAHGGCKGLGLVFAVLRFHGFGSSS